MSSRAAAAWCLLFAALHLFWALGGSVGLASSAGVDLAARRPVGFVLVGLVGVGLVLLALAVVVVASARVDSRSRVARVLAAVTLVVGVVLLVRGVAVEVLLAFAPAVRAAVGPLETRWSLWLWDPWFVVGGLLFVWAGAHGARRTRSRTTSR